ncbi:TPA: DUF1893 domain-containing protein [Candidatus Micrarchaeota archaeon]|nr:DUF1893 domain-containing protein [Candidatus Micrarchaeota archaeon]
MVERWRHRRYDDRASMEGIGAEVVRAELLRLSARGLSLLVKKGERELFSSREEGLRPLLDAIRHIGKDLEGARVIDKVVGRAAAKLLAYAGVGGVIAAVASRSAVEVLQTACIPLGAQDVVDLIRGRSGAPCPFEVLAKEIEDPAAFLQELVARLKSG